ncbi:MAG: hypothetical protein ACHP84_00880 [Caulobacterales bacterium]
MAGLSNPEQDRRIRQAWPGFRSVLITERLAIWRGELQPLSHRYEVEVIYARNRSTDPFHYSYAPFPEVTVVTPPVVRRPQAPDEPVPHIYTDAARDQPILCLFDPRTGGWSRDMAIADTILVWAAGWLRFYEAWQATGVWTGGGAPHGRLSRPPADAEREVDRPMKPQDGDRRRRRFDDAVSHGALAALLASHALERFRPFGIDPLHRPGGALGAAAFA